MIFKTLETYDPVWKEKFPSPGKVLEDPGAGPGFETDSRPEKSLLTGPAGKENPPVGALGLSQETLENFVLSHREDLLKNQEALERSRLHQEKTYEKGEVHQLWGRTYFLEPKLAYKEGAYVFRDKLYLYHKSRDREGREKILLDFYREEMKKILPDLLKKAEETTGLKAKECRIKKMKTRWGSCNIKDQRIWVNLHLAKYPEICLYSVLIHELTHFLEAGHNKRFYGLVEGFFSDYEKAQALLKD